MWNKLILLFVFFLSFMPLLPLSLCLFFSPSLALSICQAHRHLPHYWNSTELILSSWIIFMFPNLNGTTHHVSFKMCQANWCSWGWSTTVLAPLLPIPTARSVKVRRLNSTWQCRSYSNRSCSYLSWCETDTVGKVAALITDVNHSD